MTLKFRRYLYIIFILLFLIIAPLVALYGAGYDFNFKNIRLQKTGTFILDSDPSNALITIRSELNSFNLSTFFSKIFNGSDNIYTPFKIKKLMPGNYTVKMEKPGYWPWEKELNIAPGESTFAENIKLFKNNSPVLASAGKINRTFVSNNGNYMLLDRGSDAILISLSDSNELWPTIKNGLKTAPAWSPDDQKILISNKVFALNDILSDYNAGPIADLTGFIATGSKEISWGENNIIYFILSKSGKDKKNTTELVAVDIIAKTSQTVLTDKSISDYRPEGNRLITIEKNGRDTSLEIYDRSSFKLIRTINLPGGDYKFEKPHFNYITLSDSNKNIFIIDPGAAEQAVLKTKLENADNLVWMDKDRVVYYNDFEIWSMNLANNEKKIITRISAKISAVYLLPSQDYIIYATEKNIYALELDERDRRNLTTLVSLDNIQFPIIDSSGDTLYFYAEINGQAGYYKLLIRDNT